MAKVKLSKLQKAYREFFSAMMDEYDVKSPVQLGDKRSEFFNRIKKEWPKAKKAIKEGVLRQEIRAMITEVINEGTLSRVNSEIKKYKKQLENRWKTKGAYENFGEKEVRKLKDKYDDHSYSDENKQITSAIENFDKWSANYDG